MNKMQNAIYNRSVSVNGTTVQQLLKSTSMVPTHVSPQLFPLMCEDASYRLNVSIQNAFIKQLGPGFNILQMLMVDLMHAFELGV